MDDQQDESTRDQQAAGAQPSQSAFGRAGVSVGTGTKDDPGTDMYVRFCCVRFPGEDGSGVARVVTARVAHGRR